MAIGIHTGKRPPTTADPLKTTWGDDAQTLRYLAEDNRLKGVEQDSDVVVSCDLCKLDYHVDLASAGAPD